MARFKFGRKKKDTDAETSMTSSELPDETPHSYLRRPSISSKTRGEGAGSSHINDTSESPGNGIDGSRQVPILAPIQTSHDTRCTLDDENYVLSPLNDSNPPPTPWKRHKLFGSPFPRYRHAASAISSEKNEIFLMGGLKEGSVFGDTWKVVPQVSSSGTEIEAFTAEHIEIANANTPPARVGHASVLCGNAYIVYGGDTVDTDRLGQPDDDFYMFNINNGKYTTPSHVSNKPSGRYGHQLTVVSPSSASSRLYLFGGQLENQVHDGLYSFELTTFKSPQASWELVAPKHALKPPPVANHSMNVYKNRIYVFGGVYNNEKVSHDVWCYDTISNKWSQMHTSGAVPPPVNEHSACMVGDNLFVYGGNDFAGTIYDSLYCLNLHTLKWSILAENLSADGPGPRCGHSMTYLPKLHKLVIMGGDKNDYVYSDEANFDTYENFDGQEIGTMVYELDITSALQLMNANTRKMAASAGAVGAINRRPVSPSSSEDALTRHRRSLSAGIDDFQTPNGSVEKFGKSLDPSRNSVEFALPEPQLKDTPAEKFVEVDVSSSATSMNATQELNEIRESYLDTQDVSSISHDGEKSAEHEPEKSRDLDNDDSSSIKEKEYIGSPTPDFAANFESDHLNTDDLNAPEVPLFNIRKFTDSPVESEDLDLVSELGTGAIAETRGEVKLSPTKPARTESQNYGSTRLQSGNDNHVKRIIAELTAELSELRESAKTQMGTASAKIEALENRNADLENREMEVSNQARSYAEQLSERDDLIAELKHAVSPGDLAISDSGEPSPRGFTELTKYKLNRLELMNRLVYLENENAQLKQKQAQFEPFMDNQIGELSSLQKIIRAQEDRIEHLTSQVKSESILQKEISEWRHKYEDLELEFQTYRNLNAEIYITDDRHDGNDDSGLNGDSRNMESGEIISNGGRKTTASQISHRLESLVTLWSQKPVSDNHQPVTHDADLVNKLQAQVDQLLRDGKSQNESFAAEIDALKTELNSKLASLKTYEDNYRDALQSVKNTSKALDLTQDELTSQKLTIEKLMKENNELRLFKRAASASRKYSFQMPDPNNSNNSSPSPVTEIHLDEDEEEEEFSAAHYNMKLKDLEADLYIMKQDRDQLNDQVVALKKELYLVRS
ncbi:hypothetical protein OXX79_005124 [Metschnikowia pulcherrima]